jgi:hypothetical protein
LIGAVQWVQFKLMFCAVHSWVRARRHNMGSVSSVRIGENAGILTRSQLLLGRLTSLQAGVGATFSQDIAPVE